MFSGEAADHLERLASRLDLAGPAMGEARSPGIVDGFWWLTLPRKQACLELGIEDHEYPFVHDQVEKMADAVTNVRAQGGNDIPFSLKRRRTKHLAPLLGGGKILRVR